ncbi:MAG: hypothetical protein ABI347_05385 [Nitrososphaera sp.]
MLAFALAAFLLIAPAMAQEVIESPSDQGTFLVRISLAQDRLQDNAVAITFADSETGKEIEDVTYDFSVYSDSGLLVLNREGQSTPVQNMSFGSEGSYKIVISNIEGLGESATFGVQVTPEFSAFPVAAVAFSALAAWRFRRFWR